MAQAGTVWVDVRGDTSALVRDIGVAAQNAGRSLSGALGAGAKTVLGDVGRVAGVAAVGVAGIGAAAVKASTDFNKSMSGVSAVAGATAGDLQLLRDAALQAGADTAFSASEAATAEAELAKAGVSVADILGGALAGSLGLAAAGQIDLGKAAEISAQALNIFNLEGDQTTRVADVLAAGANKSAADVAQLGDALRQGGLVAAQAGLSLEETVGVLSLFADSALVGSDAGTSFKTFLQRLVPQSEAAATAMKELGLEFFDANGAFVGIDQVAEQLKRSLSGLSEEQRQLAFTTLFGSDAVRAASILYEGGEAAVDDYTSAVSDQGAAARNAAEQLNNLAGDIEAFSGSTETALIRIGDLFDSTNREVVQAGTALVNVFNDFATTPAWDAISSNIERLGAVGGDKLGEFASTISDALNNISVADIDQFFGRIEGGFGEIADAAEGLEPVIAGVGAALSTMALRSVPFIGQLIPAISPITGLLGGLVLGSKKGRDALGELGGRAADFATGPGAELLESLGSIAGELSDALVSALDGAGNALFDAADALGPVFGDAIEELGPPLADLIEAVGELAANALPVLADFVGAVLPPAVTLFSDALGIAADIVGVLADNLFLLIPAFVALKGAAIANTIGGIGTAFSKAAESAIFLKDSIGQIAATRGISQLEALKGVTKAAGGETAALAGSLATGLNVAIVGVTAAITVGAAVYEAWSRNVKRVDEETQQLTKSLLEQGESVLPALASQFKNILDTRDGFAEAFQRAGLSIAEVTEAVNQNVGDVDAFRQQWQDAGEDLATFRQQGREVPAALRPIIENLFRMADAGVISGDDLRSVIDAMTDLDQNAMGTAEALKFNAEQLDALIPKAERTAEVQADLAAAMNDNASLEDRRAALARLAQQFPELAASVGIAMDGVADGVEGVGNAASEATSALRGLSDELDKLAGAQLDVEEANRRANSSFFDLQKTLTDNRGQFGIDTEGGIANNDAIARTVEQFQRLAEAQALTDTTGQTSTRTLQGLRDQLIALRDQGLLPAGTQFDQLLSKFGLLDDTQITATVTAYTNDANVTIDALLAKFNAAKGDIEAPMEATIEALIDQGKYAEASALIDRLVAERTAQVNAEADAKRIAAVTEQLNSLPGVTKAEKAEIQAQLDAGNIAAAEAILKSLARNRQAVIQAKVIVDDGGYGTPFAIGVIEKAQGKDLNGNGVVGRAVGGPIEAGRPYLVGEEGPELVVPRSSGTVIPAAPTAEILSAPKVGTSEAPADAPAKAPDDPATSEVAFAASEPFSAAQLIVDDGAYSGTFQAGTTATGSGVISPMNGGPIEPGRPYLVGEEGPELIAPKSDGTVIPAEATAEILSAPVVDMLDKPPGTPALADPKAPAGEASAGEPATLSSPKAPTFSAAQLIVDDGAYGAAFQAGLIEKAQQDDPNSNSIVGRAIGGPIVAGLPYLVGEEGPELVLPRTSGTVIPAAPTAEILAASADERSDILAGSLADPKAPEGSEFSAAMLSELQQVREGLKSVAMAVSTARPIVIQGDSSPRRTAEQLFVQESRLMKMAAI